GEALEGDLDSVLRRDLRGHEVHERLLRGVALRGRDVEGCAGHGIRGLRGVENRDDDGGGDRDHHDDRAQHPRPAPALLQLESELAVLAALGGGDVWTCGHGCAPVVCCGGEVKRVARAAQASIVSAARVRGAPREAAVRMRGVVRRTSRSPANCTSATVPTRITIVAIMTAWSKRW